MLTSSILKTRRIMKIKESKLTPFEKLACEVLEQYGFKLDTYEGIPQDYEHQVYYYSYKNKEVPNSFTLFTNDIDMWEKLGEVRIYLDKDMVNYIQLSDLPKFLKIWRIQKLPF